jgi:starch phosphorylase
MKVLVNGGLNLSERDGWWAEAFSPEVGWALGDGLEHADVAAWDVAEAEQLYHLLEDEVVPCFYRRDESGLPAEWVGRMRESMACLTTHFSTNRMLREYVETYYLPLAEAYLRRVDGAAVALEDWSRQLRQHWARIHFGNVTSTSTESGHHFEVQVYLDELSPEALCVELYADANQGGESLRQPLQRGDLLAGAANAFVYHGTVPASRPASDYTARIIPTHKEAEVPLDANFILWYR